MKLEDYLVVNVIYNINLCFSNNELAVHEELQRQRGGVLWGTAGPLQKHLAGWQRSLNIPNQPCDFERHICCSVNCSYFSYLWPRNSTGLMPL